MRLRLWIALVAFVVLPLLTAAAETSLKGTLRLGAGGKPALETGGQLVFLSGDADTVGVLTDDRLIGSDFELVGERIARDRFRVGPIHKKSMWVHRGGERYLVTYWCEVCAIRTYTPGICQCCQEEMALDLRQEHIHASPPADRQ